MRKSKTHPEDSNRPLSKKLRIQRILRQQIHDRELLFFPLPDPPQYKPLG